VDHIIPIADATILPRGATSEARVTTAT
jgi:hypothetical protein